MRPFTPRQGELRILVVRRLQSSHRSRRGKPNAGLLVSSSIAAADLPVMRASTTRTLAGGSCTLLFGNSCVDQCGGKRDHDRNLAICCRVFLIAFRGHRGSDGFDCPRDRADQF